MEISAKIVQELRRQTGAGMMDCKSALAASNGNMEQAIEYLRKKGLKDIDKRSAKVAAEGMMGVYVHPGDQIVSLVELNCETDFVARGDDFRQLAKDLAMHVAAMNPKFLSEQDVPPQVIEKEKEIMMEQLNEQQKKNADKILPGKLAKFYEDSCLLNQSFVKDETGKVTVKALIEALSVKTGEKVSVRRFVRYEVGEGIQKSAVNFADEVASIIGA